MLELIYVRGDVLPEERFRLIESTTGLSQDLTGKTVSVEVRRLGSTTVAHTVGVLVTDAPNGKVSIDWPGDVLASAGRFRADVVVTGGGVTQTVRDAIAITVRDRP